MTSTTAAQYDNLFAFLSVFAISMIVFLVFYFIILLLSRIGEKYGKNYFSKILYKELKKFPISVWFSLSTIIALAFTEIPKQYTNLYDIVFGIIAFLFFVALVRFINRIVTSWFKHKAETIKDPTRAHYYKYIALLVRAFVWFVGMIALLGSLGVDLGSFFAFLGFTSLGLSFALRNTIKDSINSFIIVFQRPFNIGDYVKTLDLYGKVQETGLKSTKLEALDGRTLIIPNSQLMDKPLQNYKNRKTVELQYEIKIATPKFGRYERKLRKIVGEIYRKHREIQNDSVDLVLRTLTPEKHTYEFSAQYNLKKRNTLDDLNREMIHTLFTSFKSNGLKVEEVTLMEKPFTR